MSELPPRKRVNRQRRSRKSTRTRQPKTKLEWFKAWWSRTLKSVTENATQRNVAWLGTVLLLTTSLAIDAIFRAGFIPGLFNGVTFLGFIFHEFGHLACSFAPQWIHVAAGTVAQLLLPLGAIRMFAGQKDNAGCCFAACWLAVSLMHTADYMGDARAMNGDMTLSAGFWSITSGRQVRPDELLHDWKYMLQSLGLLRWDTTLAACVRMLAGTIAVTAVMANAFMVWAAVIARRK